MTSRLPGTRRAKQEAKSVLASFGTSVPIDVVSIAEGHNIEVRLEELEDAVSAMLVVRGDRSIIAVNARHHPHRRRFSVAHELGHYLLHREQDRVFIDAAVFFRRDGATAATWAQEKEANTFAAELLLPEHLIREAWRVDPIDVFDDMAMKRWADRFGVSPQALLIRLTELDLAFRTSS